MTPLAETLRPTTLADFIGQQQLVGPQGVLTSLLAQGQIPSMILWGPPGTGKTTLALLIAHTLSRPFHTLSAIDAGVREVRAVLTQAEHEEGAILFIDEIHRFSKNQQDSLLGAVERGVVTLIGATTENPSFSIIPALLSRCQVYVLHSLGVAEMNQLLQSAIRYYATQGRTIEIHETEALMRLAGGDARKLFNAVELIVNQEHNTTVNIDNAKVTTVIQQNLARYDRSGEMHYDLISAFIKSMRGSDPNAAVYWLARMLNGGEDPLFIARRMLIFASEDISNANPNALLLANACHDVCAKVGMPECRITLSQCAVYLANSAKSNSTYAALNAAQQVIRNTGDLPVPLHLRNAPTKLMAELGYADGYRYAHDYPGHFVDQEFLPSAIAGTKFYDPADNPRETETRKVLHSRWGDKYHY